MSTALDKSLDDIISSSRKARRVANNKKKTAGKGVGKAQKKAPVATKKAPKQATKQASARPVAVVSAVDLTYATKVVAHGLPKDLRQENIKDFFQSQIGGVQSVMLNYNEKGIFKGVATISFKSSKNAVKAVEKYNNAPIDGGASKLKLELVIDPSKKPLAARITANAAPAKEQPDQKKKQLQEKKKQLQKKKKDAAKAKAVAAKGVKSEKTAKKAKPEQKTAEQLDQEMADYFNN
ncbi:hypothetical protein JCM33374_g5736 [Metschnikowia sp. JCM 33374]|nr:hypothetical protein JCM33374_g5736 [Metschnikowia sp. JCM 33374]